MIVAWIVFISAINVMSVTFVTRRCVTGEGVSVSIKSRDYGWNSAAS